MAFYRCVETCIDRDRHFAKGRIYELGDAPAESSYFTEVTHEIKKKANLRYEEGLTGTVYSPRSMWDDMRFPVQAVAINPATSKPDFDFATVELLYDGGSTETSVGVGQLPHKWREGSAIHPHVHWEQDAAGVVKWQLEYKIWNNGEAEPAGWATLTAVDPTFAYVSGDLGQISEFAPIDMTGITISAKIKFKLSRLGGDAADTMVGDARFNEFDLHYEIDSAGSGREYEKAPH